MDESAQDKKNPVGKGGLLTRIVDVAVPFRLKDKAKAMGLTYVAGRKTWTAPESFPYGSLKAAGFQIKPEASAA